MKGSPRSRRSGQAFRYVFEAVIEGEDHARGGVPGVETVESGVEGDDVVVGQQVELALEGRRRDVKFVRRTATDAVVDEEGRTDRFATAARQCECALQTSPQTVTAPGDVVRSANPVHHSRRRPAPEGGLATRLAGQRGCRMKASPGRAGGR